MKHKENTSPEWSNNLTIYEVNLRQYTPQGTLRAFREHLPRLKSLGVGILWFMPIQPIGTVNRKGTLGSYYSVQDYYGINPDFGTLDEFKSLVNEIHELDMYVILDWVANHTAWNNPMASEHPEWYTKNDEGNFQPPPGTNWDDVIDLDYSNNELRANMTAAMEYWVREVGIDGFRCDMAGMVPTDFWESVIPALQKIKPVFMLAEWDDPELLENAFHADYNWGLYHVLKDIAAGEKEFSEIQEYYQTPPKSYPINAIRMNFLDNHDENSWGRNMISHFGQNLYPLVTMIFTLPGMPMIYSGQEAKSNKQLRFFDKDTIPWDDVPDSKFYQELINLRKVHKVFWNTNHNLEFMGSLPPGLVGFKRWTKDATFQIVVNLSDQDQELDPGLIAGSMLFSDGISQKTTIARHGYLVCKENR
ncbi:MAG: alpha-amylase family glycosyl hydrolase [Candidatus Neomarinimicrobiota bacterium]|nr:alpha-amylase family glycosyl hydrolase [Candidatus Neomarinimicrobiota bacterium]